MKTEREADPAIRHSEMDEYLDYLKHQVVYKLHEETQTKQGRADLIRSTGIDDLALTDELVELGITADGVIALRLFPLVLVAWADGRINTSEREAVMAEALRFGISDDSSAWLILDNWLMSRPSSLCLDAWKRYTHDTFVQMSDVATQRLIELTNRQMTSVAKSSGGHLGYGKVSEKEHSMINQIVATMKIQAK